MSILLSDQELDALEGLPHLHRCLYIFGIRRYMDYQSGITGIKRKISYKSLSEEVYVVPHQGLIDSGAKSREAIRRAVKLLEKAGLITIKSSDKNLILECILAKRDKSVQNKPDTNPTPQPDTKADIKKYNKTEENNYTVESGQILEVKPDTQADIPENAKPDTHPLSVDLIRSDLRDAVFKLLQKRQFSVPHLIHQKTVAMLKVLSEEKFTLKEIEDGIKHADAQLGSRPNYPWYYLDPILQSRTALQNARNKVKESKEQSNHETNRPRTTKNIQRGNQQRYTRAEALQIVEERQRRREREAEEVD